MVAARDDNQGVLILSTFTGASRELTKALPVNAYDTHAFGAAIEQALLMPADEQRKRMLFLRDVVRHHNVYRWVGQMLLAAAGVQSQRPVAPSLAVDDTYSLQSADVFAAGRR